MGVLRATSLPGLVFLLVLLAALERFGLWAGDRSWLPWRHTGQGTPMTAAGNWIVLGEHYPTGDASGCGTTDFGRRATTGR